MRAFEVSNCILFFYYWTIFGFLSIASELLSDNPVAYTFALFVCFEKFLEAASLKATWKVFV